VLKVVVELVAVLLLVCQGSVPPISNENLITSMPGNGALQVTEQRQQPSQHLLPDPLRPGSGQVTPVLGKILGVHHIPKVSIYLHIQLRRL
jgi:hypothetical protein